MSCSELRKKPRIGKLLYYDKKITSDVLVSEVSVKGVRYKRIVEKEDDEAAFLEMVKNHILPDYLKFKNSVS
jgi:hypothetical protein